jgi:hypothetical protein
MSYDDQTDDELDKMYVASTKSGASVLGRDCEGQIVPGKPETIKTSDPNTGNEEIWVKKASKENGRFWHPASPSMKNTSIDDSSFGTK